MGTSQSYSVSVQPLSHQPWTRPRTASLPSDISKAYLRAEKKGAVCVGYWKKEAVQGGWMVQGGCDQVQQGGSVTARVSPNVSAARGTYAGLGSSLLLSQEGDGDRKLQESYKVGMFLESSVSGYFVSRFLLWPILVRREINGGVLNILKYKMYTFMDSGHF